MRLLPFKAVWGNVVAVTGVIGTIVTMISIGQTFGWFVPGDPAPTAGLARVEPQELTWLTGRWCGSSRVTQGNVIVFAPESEEVFGRRFAAMDFGQGQSIPETDEFYPAARIYGNGTQSVIIDFRDGRYENWYVTQGPVLTIVDRVEELMFTRQYRPC